VYGLRSREEGLRGKGEVLRVMVYGDKEDVDGLFVKQIDRKRHLRDLLLWSRKRAARRREKCSAVRVISLFEAPQGLFLMVLGLRQLLFYAES